MPITSFGVIIFRIHPVYGHREYLMIRRKDTLGYVDFLRGKYQVRENDVNRQYILNMFKQMTRNEKERIRTLPFDVLWNELWNPVEDYTSFLRDSAVGPSLERGMIPRTIADRSDSLRDTLPETIASGSGFTTSSKYRNEESCSSEKFKKIRVSMRDTDTSSSMSYSRSLLESIIDESNQYDTFEEAEWGFPKGRRNYQERDYDCAVREMVEETGFHMQHLKNIKNLLPFEEIFLGSNYKSYKHKYYLMYISHEHTIDHNMNNYERAEVSCMQWKSFDECLRSIRPYNIEKKRMLYNIERCLNRYKLLYTS
jgi:8-oxo-dGTP pyrophosphatase MutT (NUDIX family)